MLSHHQVENNARAMLRTADFTVHAIAWADRQAREFAVIVLANDRPEELALVHTCITAPGGALFQQRMTVGADTRIYVAFTNQDWS